jgi:hypothetical protein
MSTSPHTPFPENNFNKTMGDIRDLKPVARKLNDRSNAFQAVLKTINEKLNELNIGLEVWTEEPFCLGSRSIDYTEERAEVAFQDGWDIGYTKIGDKWVVAARELTLTQPVVRGTTERSNWTISSTGDPVPLLSAPRQVRIEAAGEISRLIDFIKTSAERAIKQIEKAEKLAEEL